MGKDISTQVIELANLSKVNPKKVARGLEAKESEVIRFGFRHLKLEFSDNSYLLEIIDGVYSDKEAAFKRE